MSFKHLLIIYFFILILLSPLYSQNEYYFERFFKDSPYSVGQIYLKINQADKNLLSEDFYVELNGMKKEFQSDNECGFYSLGWKNEPITKIQLFIAPSILKNIQNIIIHNGAKEFFYNDFSKFSKQVKKECLNNGVCQEKVIYELPSEIQHTTYLPAFNDRGVGYRIKLYLFHLLGIASGLFNLIFFPLFLGLGYLLRDKKEIFQKMGSFLEKRYQIVAVLLFILAFALRMHDISYYHFWCDEFYSVNAAGNYTYPWIATFLDPGNPPFFYILVRLWEYVVPITADYIRFLTVIISLLLMGGIGLFCQIVLKSRLIALLGLLICAISPQQIALAQNVRGYNLSMLLIVALTICLYFIIQQKKSSWKMWGLYTILGVMAINTHYYNVLYLGGNFLFMLLWYLFHHEKKKTYLNILLSYFIIGLSFLPYFVYRAIDSAWNNHEFNTWIKALSVDGILMGINNGLGDGVYLIVSLCFLVIIWTRLRQRFINVLPVSVSFITTYCVFSISFVVLSVIGISVIRSILSERYFSGIQVLFLLMALSLLKIKWKQYGMMLIGFYFLLWTVGNTYSLIRSVRSEVVYENLAQIADVFEKENKTIYLGVIDFIITPNPLSIHFPAYVSLFVQSPFSPLSDKKIKEIQSGNTAVIITTGIETENNHQICEINNKELNVRYSIIRKKE